MGNIFANKKPASKRQVEEDYVGGGGVLDTDIYSGTIKYAYIGKAANSDARNMTLAVTVNGNDITKSIWMTNRDGDVTYYESKKEINQQVQCFEELHGLELQVAIQKQTIDKTEKDESTGSYEPTGETRDVNEFIKFFPADVPVTLGEIAQKISSLGGDFDDVLADGDMGKAVGSMTEEDGVWATKWLEKNRGETWNRAKGKAEGKSFGGGSNKSSGGGEKKSKASLFDD